MKIQVSGEIPKELQDRLDAMALNMEVICCLKKLKRMGYEFRIKGKWVFHLEDCNNG